MQVLSTMQRSLGESKQTALSSSTPSVDLFFLVDLLTGVTKIVPIGSFGVATVLIHTGEKVGLEQIHMQPCTLSDILVCTMALVHVHGITRIHVGGMHIMPSQCLHTTAGMFVCTQTWTHAIPSPVGPKPGIFDGSRAKHHRVINKMNTCLHGGGK